jgi:dienelactone hydrolase
MTIFLIFACCIIIVLLLPYGLILANPFPAPSGQWAVGTSDFTWNLPGHSGIIAKVWYPSRTQQNPHSPYIDHLAQTLSAITKGLSPLSKLILNKFYLGRIQTPSERHATLAQRKEGFPVILFSPGFGSVNFLNTFYALEFASHGFMVIGINHPGWSSGTLLVDGSDVACNRVDFHDLDRADAILAEIIEQKANNLSAVLDQLLNSNTTPDSWLYQKIDPARIFPMGHSTGGSASFLACGTDSRMTKSVNLDGFLHMNQSKIANTEKEFLLILSDRDKHAPAKKPPQSIFDILLSKDKTRIAEFASYPNVRKQLFPSSRHISFMDLSLVLNPLFSKADKRNLLLKTATTIIHFLNEAE